MNFSFGRDNLALTVFVPYDCKNNCAFCTSKKSYAVNRPNLQKVKDAMNYIFNEESFPIRDVVFTGGEPMADLNALDTLVSLVPNGLNVYINTTLTNEHLEAFLGLVNTTEKIAGINVSRHSGNSDAEWMDDQAPDEVVDAFEKKVRINCVLQGQDIGNVIDRWKWKNVEISFRKNFTEPMTADELHDPYDPVALDLLSLGFSFVGKSQCNVCDTTRFERDGQKVQYHKGLERSSVLHEDHLEINDLIIRQDGCFGYDWDGFDIAHTMPLLWKYKKLTLPYFLFPSVSDVEARKPEALASCCGFSSRTCGASWGNSICGSLSKGSCGGGC